MGPPKTQRIIRSRLFVLGIVRQADPKNFEFAVISIGSFHELALLNETLAWSVSFCSGQALERSIEEIYSEFRGGNKTKQD